MWFNLMLLAALIISVITDVKSRKIHNKVIFPGIAAAFGVHAALEGWNGLGVSAGGFFAGLGLLMIPYLLGGMGAGDVKLLALVGAMKGTTFVLMTSMYMAILGGIMALLILAFRKGALVKVKWMCICTYSYRYGIILPIAVDKEALSATYPYGVAIAGGAMVCFWLKGW